MIYFSLLAFSFFTVSIRAFQQINVTHGHWRRIPPTSYLFALGDILVVTGIVNVTTDGGSLWLAAFAMGTGGWLGCFASMFLTRRLNKSRNKCA